MSGGATTDARAGPRVRSAGSEGVLEEPEQPLGALRGLQMEPGVDRPGDHQQLGRHVRTEPVTSANEPVEVGGGRVQALEGASSDLRGHPPVAALSERVEGDDVAHIPTLPGVTDTGLTVPFVRGFSSSAHGGLIRWGHRGSMVIEAPERSGTWDLAEGEELVAGRYVVRRLGVSNAHEVYAAWDEELLGIVAAKVLRRDRVEDRRALEALSREADLLGALQHPSLPRCFDRRIDAERPHLALELIEGPRVSTVIRRQRILSVEQIVPLALQVCSALHYLAGRGLVHLDIKPKNVILAPPPRVIDLSIARTVPEARHTSGPIGTDPYMAPEQCGAGGAGRIGPPTDVWGLGATLYESLVGRRPFPAGEPGARPDLRFPQLRMDPGPLPSDVPTVLRSVIDASLERRPEDRPTAAEIVDALDPLSEMTPPKLLLGRVRVTAWRPGRAR